jgi:AraC family transcriptional regulator
MTDHHGLLRQEYVARINRVTDYIRAHLNGDLCLDTLAKVANFSPYHFHRIFRGMIGETHHVYRHALWLFEFRRLRT